LRGFSSRLISTGTKTRQPFSANRRANWDSAATPGVNPTSISGVWSASGKAMTAGPSCWSGTSQSPSPWMLRITGQRTA
jgi:hypothetical protein